MNCFNHPEKSSLISCLGCLKGLCADCGRSFEEGMVCGDACHRIVWEREQINSISKKIYGIKDGKIIKQNPKLPIFITILGIVFMCSGLYDYYNNKYYSFSPFDIFCFAQGLIFMIWGIISFIRNKKLGLNL